MKNLIIIAILSFFTFSSSTAQTKIDQNFFTTVNTFFKQQVKNGLLDYNGLKGDAALTNLVEVVAQADLSGANDATKKAFYINAYNLNVIAAAAELYPLESVQSVSGFFDRQKITVAGEKLTLNQLEKERLLKPYSDARFHFVLVCGALGCPPITDFAYQPAQLEKQLEQQTKKALNNPDFIRTNTSSGKVEISKIFQWYVGDFGGNQQSVIAFINQYRTEPISNKISYYEYDWSLNDRSAARSGIESAGGNNAARYVVSAAIPKGGIEVKWFNNLYTQRTGTVEALTDRATFLTASLSFLYGLNSRFNIGFDTRYRQVRNDVADSSPLAVFSTEDGPNSRQGFTAIGPKIRVAPFEKLENFSIQSSFVFPTGKDLAGGNDRPYIDWNGATWNTQLFNDFSIGNNFSLFTEIDILLEDIGSAEENHLNRFSTPATLIFSYFPNPKTTLYALGGFSPYWQSDFDYFAQSGLGAKYQFSPNIELELLYTAFTNQFLQSINGTAATYNIGFRYSL